MSRVIIITGASRGIGAEIAIQAAKAGFDICVNYASNQDRAEQVADQIRHYAAVCRTDNILLRVQWPGLDQKETLGNIERIGRIIAKL